MTWFRSRPAPKGPPSKLRPHRGFGPYPQTATEPITEKKDEQRRPDSPTGDRSNNERS